MWRNTSYWPAVLLQLALVSAAWSQPDPKKETAPADPSGSWKWERTFNDNRADFSLKLNWDGKKLSGEYSAFGSTSDIDDAKLDKDQLSFVAHREFNGNKFDVHFAGKVELDEINGTIKVDFGNGPQDFEWNAKRTVGADDVLGEWKLEVETPMGLIERQITISKDDDKLRGVYKGATDQHEAKDLAIKDNELSWEISGERDGRQFKATYHGKPRGNTIEGTSDFDFGGDLKGTTKFTGKRTPPEKEKRDAAKPAASEPAPSSTPGETQK